MKALLISLIFFSTSIIAATEPGLLLEEKVDSFKDALRSHETVQIGKSVVLKQIRLRLILEAGVEIPGISDASINPEVELYFKRVR